MFPLKCRPLEYSDENVLTCKYVPLKMTGTIYWRIIDVARFYLLVSRDIHKVDDRGGHRVIQPEPDRRGNEAGWFRQCSSTRGRGGMASIDSRGANAIVVGGCAPGYWLQIR